MLLSNPFEELSERLARIEQYLFAIVKRDERMSESKQFYSPKEFAHLTGVRYSTVVYRCTNGKLKARQDGPNSTWQIDVSELQRYHKEANENNINHD